MSEGGHRETAQCLCGAVRFVATVIAPEMGVCHCNMCRRWSGGNFMAVECRDVEIEDVGALGVYASSDWAERCFCRHCGSTLLWRLREGGHTAVSIQAFENPSAFRFVSQIFIDEKPSSYSFRELTRDMTGAEFVAMMTSAEHEA